MKIKSIKRRAAYFVFILLLILLDIIFVALWVSTGALKLHAGLSGFSYGDCVFVKSESDRFLHTAEVSSFNAEITPGLKRFGFTGAFIAKHPTFPIEYVRLNINPFTYMFLGDEIKDPKAINGYMDYEKMADGVWLGKYTELIKSTEAMNRFCYFYIAGIWGLFLVFLYFWVKIFRSLKQPKKDEPVSGAAI